MFKALLALVLCMALSGKEGGMTAGHHTVMQTSSNLPAGYRSVKWLHTGKSQASDAYIVTPFQVSLSQSQAKVVVSATCDATSPDDWETLFCNQSSDNQSGSLIIRQNSTGGVVGRICGIVGNDNLYAQVQGGVPFTAVYDKGLFYVDGLYVGQLSSPSSTLLSHSLYYGNVSFTASWMNNRVWNGCLGRMSVYMGDSLLVDCCPCIHVSSGVYGFYETVSKQFITSSGASQFLKGSPS